MYNKSIITRRRDSFNPNCVSNNGTRRANALKVLEKRQEMTDKSHFRENVRKASVTSIIEFDEEAWVDKGRAIAFAGSKFHI